MCENQNTQSKIVNPYTSISVAEGAPFIIRRNHNGQVTSVVFNQSWNAAFMIERLHPEYISGRRLYRLRGVYGTKIVGEDGVCSHMANDLARYWRKFHPELAGELLPRLTNSVLHSSVRMLRGRIRKD